MTISTFASSILLLIVIALRRSGSHDGGPSVGSYAALGLLGLIASVFVFAFVRGMFALKRFEKLTNAVVELHDRRKYSDALMKSDEAMEVARKARLRADDTVAKLFVVRSMVLKALGRKDDALGAAAHGLACLCRVKNGGMQLAILDQIGTLLFETNHERRAIPLLEAAAKLAMQIENEPRRSYRLQQIGLAYSRTGVHANSVAAFGKAIELMTKEKGADWAELSNLYINLGNGYRRLQKLEDAERCYRESLRLLEVNHVTEAEKLSTPLMNLGVACAETGRNQEAEKYYKQVLEMRLKVYGRNDWRIGNAYNNLASCRRREGDLTGAEQYVQQALEILEVRPESMCHACETLSRIREDQGRTEEAIAAIVKARDLMQGTATPEMSQVASFYEREAMLAARLGDEQRAAECNERARQIKQKLAAAPAVDHESKNVSEALKTLDEHLRTSMQYMNSLQEIG